MRRRTVRVSLDFRLAGQGLEHVAHVPEGDAEEDPRRHHRGVLRSQGRRGGGGRGEAGGISDCLCLACLRETSIVISVFSGQMHLVWIALIVAFTRLTMNASMIP